MSNRTPELKQTTSTVTFVPVGAAPPSPPPSPPPRTRPPVFAIVGGVLLPAAAIITEATTRMCAEAFFDPMPSTAHAIAVCAVPMANLALILALYRPASSARAVPALRVLAGLCLAIACLWAALFLPLLPLSAMAILVPVMLPLALLPWAPLTAALVVWGLHRRLMRTAGQSHRHRPLFATGFAAGLAVVLALDIGPAASNLGVRWAASPEPQTRANGLALLRTLGSEVTLRRLCYDGQAVVSGPLSTALAFAFGRTPWNVERPLPAITTTEAREIYWRVYGTPFNAKPVPVMAGPRWRQFTDFAWDGDHGGTTVGGRIKGLDLASSRLDGSIAADDAVAYLEWTVAFANASQVDREARLELALPPGAVVSRATLWVDGEEREAAYAGKAHARAAYRKVAVQQRRDPLLVTTKGPDRILAQAFPVPRNGGTIKFKLGMTVPLDLTDPAKAGLVLPAIVDRNFGIGPDAGHAVWIDGKSALSPGSTGLSVSSGGQTISGTLSDRLMSGARQAVFAARDPGPRRVTASIAGVPPVTQAIVSSTAGGAGQPDILPAVMIVLDGSVSLARSAAGVARALDGIAPKTPVGLVIAGTDTVTIPMAEMTPAHRATLQRAIAASPYTGGQDNAAGLAAGLRALDRDPAATLLWVHGPQPVELSGARAALEQAIDRQTVKPRLVL
jgi:hypothetical protein